MGVVQVLCVSGGRVRVPLAVRCWPDHDRDRFEDMLRGLTAERAAIAEVRCCCCCFSLVLAEAVAVGIGCLHVCLSGIAM
jgi:hypothetical protein